jgi:hypothetical protein
MIAPSAPSSLGDVAPIGSPEDGRAVTLVAAARRVEHQRHPLVSLRRLLDDLAAEPAELAELERRVHRLRVDLDA